MLFNLAGKDGAAALGEVEALAGLLALAHLLLDGGTDGGDLQLCAHDLGLLLLKSGLSLLEGSLELFLFKLEPLAGLVELVGGAASLAKLIGQVVDLISKVLVLAAESLDRVVGLLNLGLDPEELSGVAAGLLLGVL